MTRPCRPAPRLVTLTVLALATVLALPLTGPAVAAGGTGGTSQTQQRPALAPGVPSLARARQVVRSLHSRDSSRTRILYVPGRRCDRQVPVQGAAGRLAIYSPAGDATASRDRPQVFSQTLRFASRAQARQVFARYARFTRSCRRLSNDVSTSTTTPVALPRVGDQRTGYLITSRPRTGDLPPAWGRYATVRRGKVLVVAWMVSAHDAAPRARWHRRWVQLAVRSAR